MSKAKKAEPRSRQKLRHLILKAKGTRRVETEEKCVDAEAFVESCLSFGPSPNTQFLKRREADRLLNEGQPTQAARCYTQYQALTFKQQYLQQLSKKKHKTMSDVMRGKANLEAEDIGSDLMETENKILGMLEDQETSMENQVAQLPPHWTIVQISCYDSFKYTRFKTTKRDKPMREGNPNLVIVRLNNDGSSPLVVRALPQVEEVEGTLPFLLEQQNIIEEMMLLLKDPCDDREKYWNFRNQLNDRMQNLVKSAENNWLGAAKSLLLGKLPESAQEKVNQVLQEVCDLLSASELSSELEQRTKLLLSSSKYLNHEQIFGELIQLFPDFDKDAVFSASSLVLKYSKGLLDFETERRDPVILILDSDLQCFPWESLPGLTSSRQAVSRVPSLQYLATMWRVHLASESSLLNSGICHESVFYMINPDKNLPKTQERLEGVMKGYSAWEGISGEAPQPGQLATMLSNKDTYIYSGHGSGSIFMSSDEIKKLKIRSVPILLGCRSAELTRYGRSLDPLGITQSYLVGSSPAIAGFLWPITDADVDQWTIKFLDYWLKGTESNLLQAIADQRSVFRHFVNSAGLVVNGFPISLKQK